MLQIAFKRNGLDPARRENFSLPILFEPKREPAPLNSVGLGSEQTWLNLYGQTDFCAIGLGQALLIRLENEGFFFLSNLDGNVKTCSQTEKRVLKNKALLGQRSHFPIRRFFPHLAAFPGISLKVLRNSLKNKEIGIYSVEKDGGRNRREGIFFADFG